MDSLVVNENREFTIGVNADLHRGIEIEAGIRLFDLADDGFDFEQDWIAMENAVSDLLPRFGRDLNEGLFNGFWPPPRKWMNLEFIAEK